MLSLYLRLGLACSAMAEWKERCVSQLKSEHEKNLPAFIAWRRVVITTQ